MFYFIVHTWNFIEKFLLPFLQFSYDSKATYEPSWRTDVCMTENLMDNLTRCMCPISGTFVVLLVKKNFNVSISRKQHLSLKDFDCIFPFHFISIPLKVSLMKPPSVPMIVVICCGCCFLQSTIAFVILLPNIYIRRCYISINFAIMQFCLSITATMAFIILGLLKFLPQVSPIYILFTRCGKKLQNSL